MARTYSFNQWTTPTGNVNGIAFPILYGSTGINQLTTPTITSITTGDSQMVISFTDTNNYGTRNNVYAIFGNGLTLGYATATNLGGSSKSTTVAGFTNGVTYAMQMAAMAYSGNAQFPNIGYQQSDLSNTINAFTSWELPYQQWSNIYINSESSRVDVVRIPNTLYSNCSLIPTSTYTWNGGERTGVYLDQNMSIGLYDGIIKLKARVVPGALDGTYAGEVDYVFEDIDVNVLLPFSDIYNSDGKKINTIYDDATEPLCPNCPDTMSSNMRDGINSALSKQYYISMNFLKENIRSFLKNDINEAMKSRDAARRFMDILNFQAVGLSNYWKEYEIPYKGTIWIRLKILVGSDDGDIFNYNILDGNNKILKSGRNAGVIVFPDLANSAAFSFGVLRAVSSTNDLVGV